MISDHHTMTATTDQWTMMQLYQQSPVDDDDNLLEVSTMLEGLISDHANNSTVVTTTTSSSSPSPTSPKAAVNNGPRPIRRRSRASKRTPTTLLNANTTNFRALVQQFTGCPSTTAMSFEVYKGPITLNFKQGSRQVLHHHHNRSRTMVTTTSPAAAAAPFGNTGFKSEGHHHDLRQYQYQQQLAQQQQQQWRLENQQQQQWRLQDQQQQSVDDNTDLFSSSINSSSSKPSMEISDDCLIMDYNYSLHDLTTNNASFFSNNDDAIQNGTYYM